MRIFKDTEGRDWVVTLNVSQLKRVKTALGINLFAAFDRGSGPFRELLDDLPRLVDVLFLLVRDQAEKRGLSDEDFGRALAGDVIEAAIDAFIEELIDFFPGKRVRDLIRKTLQALRERAKAKAEQAEQAILAMTPEDLEALADGHSSGSAPASAVSIPAP